MSESEPKSGRELTVVPRAKQPRISAAIAADVVVPVIIADAGDQAARRFLEFFAATIRNKNTRMAYYHAVCRFFVWCDKHQLGGIADIEPLHVSAYIEAMQTGFEKPSVKQHLAAIRMLFDWLVTGQVVATNPAHSVRGPKHVVKTGKTTVLNADPARKLLDSIDISTVVGLRDRALIRPCGRNPSHAFLADSRIGACSNHCVTGIRESDMLTGMTERDWLIALEVFDAVQSSRGQPGRDDRKFLEAIHYFTVHSISWRALPDEFGNWNSVWKRFWRLSRSGVFEAFFQVLAECSETAHLIQFFDSTTARAHVSAAGAKGGSSIRPSAARVAASRPRSTSRPISTGVLSTSI